MRADTAASAHGRYNRPHHTCPTRVASPSGPRCERPAAAHFCDSPLARRAGTEIINEQLSAYVDLKGSVDAAAEIQKLNKRLDMLQKIQANLQKQMQSKDYEAKVPENVRAENTEKLAKLAAEMEASEAAIAEFQKQLAA